MTRLALAAALLVPAAAAAQPPAPRPPVQVKIPRDGSELFRALLDQAGVKPITQAEWERRRPSDDVIVIVMGSGRLFQNGRDSVQSVLDAGGAALIASDGYVNFEWKPAQIGPGRVRCDDPARTLRGLPDCPFVVPAPPDHDHAPVPGTPLAGVFAGLTRVATNNPAPLTVRGFWGEMNHILALYPNRSKLVQDGGLGPLPEDVVFAAGGEGGWRGEGFRFLAMGDQSVFINQMLLEPDTDNLRFAARVVDYLRGPRRRGRCLFVENGQVVREFDGLRKSFEPGVPMPDLGKLQEKVVDLADAGLDRLQTQEVPDRLLNRAFPSPAIPRFLLVAGALLATGYLLRRAFASRRPTDAPPPPNVPGAPTGPPGVFDRRQRELIRRDNLYEPVRDRVREFFDGLGAGGGPGAPPPRLSVSPAVRRPGSLREAVREFWAIAYGPPQEVTAVRWRDLQPYLDRLRRAHADGKWRFAARARSEPEA